jgi:hypothetical protein
MTEKTTKITPEHKDKLGRVIAIDDYVAYPSSNRLMIGRVAKLNPKMLSVKNATGRGRSSKHVYPDETVLIDASRVTFYLIQNSG